MENWEVLFFLQQIKSTFGTRMLIQVTKHVPIFEMFNFFFIHYALDRHIDFSKCASLYRLELWWIFQCFMVNSSRESNKGNEVSVCKKKENYIYEACRRCIRWFIFNALQFIVFWFINITPFLAVLMTNCDLLWHYIL